MKMTLKSQLINMSSKAKGDSDWRLCYPWSWHSTPQGSSLPIAFFKKCNSLSFFSPSTKIQNGPGCSDMELSIKTSGFFLNETYFCFQQANVMHLSISCLSVSKISNNIFLAALLTRSQFGITSKFYNLRISSEDEALVNQNMNYLQDWILQEVSCLLSNA